MYLVVLLSTQALAGEASEGGVKGEVERWATTTPEEMLTYTGDSLRLMRQEHRSLQRLMNRSGAKLAIHNQHCLKQRLEQIAELVDAAAEADLSIQAAIGNGDPQAAMHAYRMTAIARAKTEILVDEATTCAKDPAERKRRDHVDHGADWADATQVVERLD